MENKMPKLWNFKCRYLWNLVYRLQACNSKYKIEIKPNEAEKLKFWNYYRNEGNPDSIRWGTGLYRFMKDEDARRLLADIVEVKKNTVEYELAEDILKYFDELHV